MFKKKSPYNNKEYIVNSNTVRFLTKNKCKICKTKHTITAVHHIDGNTENNNLTNLTVLCPLHHRFVHLSDVNPESLRNNYAKLFYKAYKKIMLGIEVNIFNQTNGKKAISNELKTNL